MKNRKWVIPLLTGLLIVLLTALVIQGRQLQAVRDQAADSRERLEAAQAVQADLQAEVERLLAEQAELQAVYEQVTSPKPPSNPIDAFFQPLLQHCVTAEAGFLYYEYGKAWQNELYGRAEQIRANLVYPEDMEVLDNYLAAVEAEAEAMTELAWLLEARWDIPPDQSERYFYSGTGFRQRIEEKIAAVYQNALPYEFFYYGPYVFDEAAFRLALQEGGYQFAD